jgi:serine/threonine protein kinase
MVMPLIEGITIHDYCKKTVDERNCAEVFLKAAIALNELHKHGYIHGDIRPGNILVETIEDDKYRIRLIDFSFSKNIGKEVYYGDLDDIFFAPEVQKSFVSAHPAQDSWALAKTFAWLIECESISEDISKQLRVQFPSIFEFINLSSNHAPLKRPTLDNFIMQLSSELQSNLIKNLANEANNASPISLRIG